MAHVELVEAIGGNQPITGKRWRARIVAGDTWGSSAYYPKDVLERDGARVFTTGLSMYLNHPTQTEQYDRPERAVQDLVGKLTSDATYESDGLYADVEFYDSFVAQINEKHEDVGLSIRAQGMTEDGEIDGRYGPILVAFLAAQSVDVVTKAGAGGKLTSILESDRDLAGKLIETNKEGTQSVAELTKEDFEAFVATLTEAIAGIPAALAESLAAAPVVEAVVPVVEADVVDEVVVVIDHAAIVEALATNHLPAASAAKIVAALTEGGTLEAAVQEQIALREAFTATVTSESGTVILNESGAALSGLARSISVLG